MTDRTVFGWRRVALILASERDRELLAAAAIPEPIGPTRAWARQLLDDVEDFYEIYDVEPDGGDGAARIEDALRPLAGDASMDALSAACEIFSRPTDERSNVSHWVMLLDLLTSPEDRFRVPPPPDLPARVAAVLASIGWPRTDDLEWRPPQYIKDPWEFEFWRETHVEAEQLADELLEARYMGRVLAHLADALSPDERAALVAWANAEDDARQGEPRPSIWPPKVPLRLPGVPWTRGLDVLLG